MTARKCFTGKIAAGKVSGRAAGQILEMLDAFEREHQAKLGDAAGARQAALEAAAVAKADAARRADEVHDAIVTQSKVLRAAHGYEQVVGDLRKQPGDWGWGNRAPPMLGKQGKPTLGLAMISLLTRDIYEISTWSNVSSVGKEIRGEAHRLFADGIEFLRAKGLGFKSEATRELDVLRALYKESGVEAQAAAVAKAWDERVAPYLAESYRAVGGQLAKLENWRLPNPTIDVTKVRSLGIERVKALIREHADRGQMLDYATGEPLNDTRFEQVIHEAVSDAIGGFVTGQPSGAFRGRKMLANSRDAHRVFVWKSAESWLAMAEAIGEHASPYQSMMDHIEGMANDTAMMRILGRNPEATKRFMLDLFDREAGRRSVAAPAGASDKEIAAVHRGNRAVDTAVGLQRKLFESVWAEVSGLNRIPVNTGLAQTSADVRNVMSASQLGSALISSFGDSATLAMTTRFNGLQVMNVIARATAMMTEKGAEVFAAQMGLTMDTLAHVAGANDRLAGESIRSGVTAKIAGANIRLSGLRRWTAILRAAFGLETMAEIARVREINFAELAPRFRAALERYGIGESDWKTISATQPYEPRPNALFVRPADVAEGGTMAHRVASEKLARMINTEMDYAVIDRDPFTRALLLGESQPGTLGGEARRSVTQYRSFPATILTTHLARAVARGWDGSRLGHGALTLIGMTLFGVLSMQAKQIAAGRDPLTLDPTTGAGLQSWGKAVIQGGGLGAFGDVVFIDQTRYGNTWAATLAGPVAGQVEKVLGDFVLKNVQLAAKGQPTHFAGDALYAAAGMIPGSSLWLSRLAFQRTVLDQLALMTDSRARDRFARMEETARKEFGQRFWWRPGRLEPQRAPEFGTMFENVRR